MYKGQRFLAHKRTHNVNADIHAARTFIPRCVFDKEACEDGLKALKSYHKKWNDDRNKFEDKPYHDWSSHAADAFRYLAVGYRDHMGEEVPDTSNPSNYPTFNELMGTSHSEPQRRRI